MSKKKSVLSMLSSNQAKKCHGIIHSFSVTAGAAGTGLAQIPLADSTIIMPVQIAMVISLGKVFGLKVTKTVAGAIVRSAAASFVGRGAVQLIVGWVPGVGNAINTATAAGLTELIGWNAVATFIKDPEARVEEKEGTSNKGSDSPKDEDFGTNSIELQKRADKLVERVWKIINGDGSGCVDFDSLENEFQELDNLGYRGDDAFYEARTALCNFMYKE